MHWSLLHRPHLIRSIQQVAVIHDSDQNTQVNFGEINQNAENEVEIEGVDKKKCEIKDNEVVAASFRIL